MALKLAGCVLIILSTTGIGIVYGKRLLHKSELLMQIKNIALRIKNEMIYFQTPMPELLRTVAERADCELSPLLIDISKQLEEYDGDVFLQVWQERLGQYASSSALSKTETEQLMRMGACLADNTAQSGESAIDGFLCELALVIEEAGVGLKDRIKLFRSLGILAGIFIVILIV